MSPKEIFSGNIGQDLIGTATGTNYTFSNLTAVRGTATLVQTPMSTQWAGKKLPQAQSLDLQPAPPGAIFLGYGQVHSPPPPRKCSAVASPSVPSSPGLPGYPATTG